jgi:hypothetical protein
MNLEKLDEIYKALKAEDDKAPIMYPLASFP